MNNMNERIKQLAEQAKLQLDQDIKDDKKDWKNTPQSYDEMVQEKFAELIVRECAQACINMGNDYEIKSAGQYQAELFAFAIKKHFGVEL